ncbi:hypothetical protein BD324DRAFT_438406 [Kockovaella imperatae]|uniref:Uncharacterized protein n=1 Tax=Kockovaella imperatae TaxID=4999 RepID=A0A1Y1UGW0_9TREE|nr:hypothetical protein BD324DRAFT_438406 [Kockovaella imperatae]ORX37278.1 hypothetical protein BD324DRAFT_438406 [Kockovaella imperatae]
MARSRSGSMSQGAASSHRAGSSDRATVLSRLETLSKGQNIHSGLSNGRTDDSSPADDIASSQGKSASNGISLSRPNSLQSKNMTPRAQESSSTGDTTTLMGQKRSSTRATSSTLPASQLTPKWSAVNGSLRKVASEGRRIGGSNHDSDPADEEEEEEPEEEVEDEAEEEVEAFEDALESLNGSEEEGGEKEAGSSRMSRINSNNSRSSSDPLVLRGQNESDELEDTDRAPIEILDDSSSGSESILRPGRRLKRRQLRNPSVELLDAPDHGKKDKGKGKAKAEPWSNVIMEIPLKPLAKLRTYSYPDKFARFIPDQSTRLSLSYSSGSHLGSGRNNHTTDHEDDDEEDSYGDPESDPIALRRSRRHDRKSPTRRIPRTRATRAQERVNKDKGGLCAIHVNKNSTLSILTLFHPASARWILLTDPVPRLCP